MLTVKLEHQLMAAVINGCRPFKALKNNLHCEMVENTTNVLENVSEYKVMSSICLLSLTKTAENFSSYIIDWAFDSVFLNQSINRLDYKASGNSENSAHQNVLWLMVTPLKWLVFARAAVKESQIFSWQRKAAGPVFEKLELQRLIDLSQLLNILL